MRTAIIVVGMHRSGTSALTGMIAKLGVAAPRTMMPQTADNERGYWESTPIRDFHDRVLATLESGWNDPGPLPSGWETGPAFPLLVEGLVTVLQSEFGDTPLFVVKDPRTSRLLPLWFAALDRLQASPRFVLCVRAPAEVAASLERRDGMSHAQAQMLWLRYTLEAERGTRGHPRVIVPYAGLLGDWRAQAQTIATRTGLAWPQSIDDSAAAVDAFLSTELRHHREAARKTAALKWLTDVEAAMVALTAGESPEAERTLDRVFGEVTAVDAASRGRIVHLTRKLMAWLRRVRRSVAPGGTWRDRVVRGLLVRLRG